MKRKSKKINLSESEENLGKSHRIFKSNQIIEYFRNLKMSNLLLVKPEKLDKIQKPIDEAKYFQWKETLLDCAHQKADWSEFTKPTSTWKARNEDATRGEENASKRAHLNSYITYVATFAPGSLVHDIINESTGNAYIDSRIRSMYQLKSTGASAFKYWKKTKSTSLLLAWFSELPRFLALAVGGAE